jgi:hypothetical protein
VQVFADAPRSFAILKVWRAPPAVDWVTRTRALDLALLS